MARKIVCLRYFLVSSFILLTIFGLVICGIGSYLVHQLHSSLTISEWFDPPAILLSTGIVNFLLGPYFCYYFDTRYNQAQLFMFSSIVVLVMIVQAGAGLWALVNHTVVDSVISDMLESKLASAGTINITTSWNISGIKLNCCGFSNISVMDGEIEENKNTISWSCCNTRQYDSHSPVDNNTCAIFFTHECRHLAFHRYRSILFHTFVLGLCAMGLQALVMMGIKSYSTAMRKLLKKRRAQTIVINGNAPPRNTYAMGRMEPQRVYEGFTTAEYHCN